MGLHRLRKLPLLLNHTINQALADNDQKLPETTVSLIAPELEKSIRSLVTESYRLKVGVESLPYSDLMEKTVSTLQDRLNKQMEADELGDALGCALYRCMLNLRKKGLLPTAKKANSKSVRKVPSKKKTTNAQARARRRTNPTPA
jgi:hypothetical protein